MFRDADHHQTAILSYLTRHYDPDHKFSFSTPDDISLTEQWMAWQHGGLGPMQGQANHFYRLAKERIPYPTQRYIGETERLFGILDTRLNSRDYLVGPGRGKYSIADIASFGWANGGYFAGIDVKSFSNVQKWLDRINTRPAVQKGLSVPTPSRFKNDTFLQRLDNEVDMAEKEQELRNYRDKAKELYNYKYASP